MGTKEESNFKKESITSGDFKNISLIDFSIPSKNSKQHHSGKQRAIIISIFFLQNPFFGFFGYHGFGGRPPYYSEEMFEDFEKPKEEDPPKTETPATDPSVNSTVPETNSTQPGAPSPRAGQGGNDTSPAGNNGQGPNTVSNPTVQNNPVVNVSGQGVPRSQTPWRPSQTNVHENYPHPNIRQMI